MIAFTCLIFAFKSLKKGHNINRLTEDYRVIN